MAELETALQDSADLGGHKVRVYPVTRIMGRADIEVVFSPDQQVTEARFRAMEYRGFEQMVVGLPAFRAPAFLSRICGSCGPFHQLAACMAIENASGTDVPGAASWFRELLCWLWLGTDHLLNITYRALPDFALPMSDTAVRNVVGLYAVEQETIQRLSAVLSAFNEALSILAGLPVHPSVVVPGGVSYLPDWSACTKATVLLNGCGQDLRETLRLVEMLTKRNAQMLDTASPFEGRYLASTIRERPALLGDRVTAAPFRHGESVTMDARAFCDSISEEPVPWSYLIPAAVGELGPLLVGPLARVNLGFDTDTPSAELECKRITGHWGRPLDREFLFLMAITLEVIWAWEKALLLLEQRPKVMEPCVMPKLVESDGVAVVDSPRGTIVHRARMDQEGVISSYQLLSPLQFNCLMLNRHLSSFARKSLNGMEISEVDALGLQLSVRAFSPCVPCGTH